MAISAVHYPFHNKSCCLLQPPFGSGAQRCFLIFQLTGKVLGLSPCLLADLAAELLELLLGFCAGGIDRKLARGIRVSQHLLRLALGFGYRDLGLSFRLSNIAYCFK